MCNRFKSKIQLAEIRVLGNAIKRVLHEAEVYEQREDIRPSDETLVIWERDGELVLGTAFWGFAKLPGMGKGLVINARSERVSTSSFWRDTTRCWLPATSWVEYIKEGGRNVPQEVCLPDRSPFLIAGVCGIRDGSHRMAMQMQDAPERFAYLCDRLPIPYGFDGLREKHPKQIMAQMEVTQISG
jgi:putative SOS response-associated peptidase YedK